MMNTEFDTMKMTLTTSKSESGGYVLILALIVTLALMTIGFSLAQVAASKYASTKKRIYDDTAVYAAEAGVSETVSQLNDNPGFAGFTTEKTLDSSESRTTFTTAVTAGPNTNSRYIESTGSVYTPASATTSLNTKKIQVLVNKNTSAASYSMFAGPGGVSLGSTASLQAPSTYSSGPVVLNADSGAYGSSSSTHNAVNTSCTQSGSNMYPSLCPSSQEPFTINSTATGVSGSVCAHRQSPSAKIPNLTANCSPLLAEIKPMNRTNLRSGTIRSGFACYSGARTIEANSVYTGNLTTIGGSCNLTINGNMYVEGNLTINGSSTRLIVPDSAGSEPPIIIVTGEVRLSGTVIQPNFSGTSLRIISTRSSTSCSTNPSCPALGSPAERQSSQILDGITCDDSCQADGAQLIAYFARVTMSGNTLAGSIAGQSISIPTGTTTLTGAVQTNRDVVNKKWAVVDYQRKAIP